MMLIETVPVQSLVFDPANARTHNPKNIDAIKSSLARFGQQVVRNGAWESLPQY